MERSRRSWSKVLLVAGLPLVLLVASGCGGDTVAAPERPDVSASSPPGPPATPRPSAASDIPTSPDTPGRPEGTASPRPGGGSAPSAPPATVSAEGEFTLAPGQSWRSPGGQLVVTFVRVVQEGRCPVADEIECVWSGDAVVAVSVAVPGREPTSVELHTAPAKGSAATVAGCEVWLTRLAPDNGLDPIAPAAYRASLRVRSS
jgi:hypothetical protein